MTRSLLRLCTVFGAALVLGVAGASAQPAPADDAAQPDQPLGRLSIHAVQGTPGGPGIGAIEAEIELRHNNSVVARMTTQLDEGGNAVVEDVPLGAPVVPVVKVRYADVYYIQSGQVMTPADPDEEVTVTCYQTTTEEPPWHILMRHVMLVSDPHGLRITEIVQIRSEGQRTWLGTPHASAGPITTSFSIPALATDIRLMQGFHGWENTSAVGSTLYNHLPLMPGDTEMTFSYAIHSHQDEAPLAFSAPVLTQHAMIIVPENVSVVRSANIEPGGTRIADTDVQFYMAQAVLPGAELQITVAASGAQRAVPMADYAPPPGGARSSSMIKWIAAAGGAVILLAAGALLLFRRGSAPS